MPVPSAWESNAANGACKSVANPGKTAVSISTERHRDFVVTRISLSPSVTSAPASRSLEMGIRRCSDSTFLTKTSPPMAAAAIIKVPASIRSGITECSQPCKLSTPSMRMVSVPAPRILAPILFRRIAVSTISGSLAGLSNTVVPSAKAAASITFTVVPTLARLI